MAAKSMTNQLVEKSKVIYEKTDRLSGGWISILLQSYTRFVEMRGAEAAASLGYYALFSLFPLTLVLVALMGFILESEEAYQQTVFFITQVFPFSGDLVRNNLSEVFKERSTVGVIGLLGALWAASGYFATLAHSINRAWPLVKLRGLVQSRLLALGMIGALLLLLIISLISTTLYSLLPSLIIVFGGDRSILESTFFQALLRLVPAIFTLLFFIALYRWVPNKTVAWKAVITGAIIVTVVWELAKSAFTLYLRSGLPRYEFIYGSLGTLIVLMVWIYLSNLIALFGAYLVATLEGRVEKEQKQHPPERKTEPAAPKGVHG
jgi:membrane protein